MQSKGQHTKETEQQHIYIIETANRGHLYAAIKIFMAVQNQREQIS